MKVCTGCGQELPRSEFYAHPRAPDGLRYKCKACFTSMRRETNRRRYANDPTYRAERREAARASYRRTGYRSPVDPTKRSARVTLQNAVREGRLTPSDGCEDCGHDFSEFRREAHHEDYSKPLDVAWLCSLCHGKRHRRVA